MKHFRQALEQVGSFPENGYEEINDVNYAISCALESISFLQEVKENVEKAPDAKVAYLACKKALTLEAKQLNFKISSFVSTESATDDDYRRIAVEGVSDFIENVWKAIKNAFKWMWEKIKALFSPSEESKRKKEKQRIAALLEEMKKLYKDSIALDKEKIKESVNNDLNLINCFKGFTEFTKDKDAVTVEALLSHISTLDKFYSSALQYIAEYYNGAINIIFGISEEAAINNVDDFNNYIILKSDEIINRYSAVANASISTRKGVFTNNDNQALYNELISLQNNDKVLISTPPSFFISPYLFKNTYMYSYIASKKINESDQFNIKLIKFKQIVRDNNSEFIFEVPDNSQVLTIYNKISASIRAFNRNDNTVLEDLKKLSDAVMKENDNIMGKGFLNDESRTKLSNHNKIILEILTDLSNFIVNLYSNINNMTDAYIAYLNAFVKAARGSEIT
jgi:hypothetical protein